MAAKDAVRSTGGGAEAHFNRANALHAAGKLSEAAASYRSAAALAPQVAAIQINLGATLQLMGDHAAAVAALRRATALDPRSVLAQFNLGMSLEALGELSGAADAYETALRLDPNAAPVHVQLGLVRESQGRVEDAIQHYRRAAALDSGLAVAHNNLGAALRTAGKLEEAAAAYREAVRAAPDSAPVQANYGMALNELHRNAEALAAFERALAIDPELAEAHKGAALALLDERRVAESFAHFMRHAEIVYGAPGGRGDWTAPAADHKRKHDLEQLDYLIAAGVAPDAARAVKAALARGAAPGTAPPFHHIDAGARLAGPAIDPANIPAEVEARWLARDPKLLVIDNVLTPAALDALRRFCMGSTIWRHVNPEGYVAALPESGFAAPLIAQIATELAARFPGVFHEHRLTQCWAFKYDQRLRGTGSHADLAAVNVNIWITSEDANEEPEGGGLEVWNIPAPADWDFDKYNNDRQGIVDFLQRSGARSITVPYRANRAVIFDSDLFHRTAGVRFKPGYANRRINVTFLYGFREQDATPSSGAKW